MSPDSLPHRLAPRARAAPAEPAALLRSGRLLAEWWAVLLLATVGILLLNRIMPPVLVDNLIYDGVQRMRPPAPSPDILIVSIDNRSLAELGRWPWPRRHHAAMLEQLAAKQPRLISYDVLFLDMSEEDDALAAAVARAGRVVLPYAIDVPGPDGAPSALLPPAGPLATAAAGLGHVMVRPDRDGVVRAIDRLENLHGARMWHMAEAGARLLRGETVGGLPDTHGGAVLAPAQDLIRFAAGPGSYAQVPFVDVMMGRVPDALIRDRIILVGATGAGMGDRFSTPMSGTMETMAGVELNANYLDNLLSDRLVRPAPHWLWQIFSVLPLWLLMAALLFLGPRLNLWAGLLLGLAVLGVSFLLLALFRFWLPPTSALLAIGIIYPLWGWRRLDFASRYIVSELGALRTEQALLPRSRTEPGGDMVERQITLMHEAIRDARDLRRFIAQSLDSLPDAALVTDLDGRVVIANDAADALFADKVDAPLIGLPLERVLRSLDRDPRLPDPQIAALLRATEQGALPPSDGLEIRTSDGRSLEIRLAFFTDAERHALGWIARFADITSLRASERQREDALRLLTHDMRAPQASILALLEAEGQALPPDLSRRVERYARQTLILADDFVNLARAESGNYQVETFNLADAVLDATDDIYPLARTKHIHVLTDVPDAEALVLGDRALLTRAITNFLTNAIKYSDENTEVTARLTLGDGYADVAVIDQGRGISPGDLGQLFEPFRRLAAPEGAAPQADGSGAGLGLAFVKAVVERHRGSVGAESQVGVGSVFRMRIPTIGV